MNLPPKVRFYPRYWFILRGG